MSAAATGPGEPLALEQLRATAVRRAEAHAEALLECVALGMEPDGDEGIGEGTLAGERKVPEAATGDDGSSGEATDADDADEDDSDDQCRREREEQECLRQQQQGAPTGTGTASSSSSSAGDEEDAGALRFEGGMPPEYTALDAWVAYKSGDRALQLYKPRDLIDPSATEEEKKKQLSRWYKFNEYNRLIETLIKEHDARAKSEWAERRRQATEEADSEDRDEEPVEVWKEGPVSLEEAKHMFFTIDNTWTSNRMTQIVYRTVLKKLSVRRRNNAPPAQSVKRRRRH